MENGELLEPAASEYQSQFLEVDKEVEFVELNREHNDETDGGGGHEHGGSNNHKTHEAERASLSGAGRSCKTCWALLLLAFGLAFLTNSNRSSLHHSSSSSSSSLPLRH